MAFLLQADDGSVDDANAYISAAEFKAYHGDRGTDVSDYGTADIEKAVVKATDYVDFRFHPRFIGSQITLVQRTAWPRSSAYDSNGFNVSSTIPGYLKDAVAEYTLRALVDELAPDPVTDPTGRPILRKLVKAGPVTTEVEYAEGNQVSTIQAYPKADRMMAPILFSARRLVRS